MSTVNMSDAELIADSDKRTGVEIFHLKETYPVQWHENKIGATQRPWWFYNVSDVSQWFKIFCISCLQPGQSEGFHSHLSEHEGPYECWYFVIDGEGQLRTEYADHTLSKFDAAFMPPDSSHQMRNSSLEPLWYMTLSSRGGHPLNVDTYLIECSEDRPGYWEEFQRIMAVRKARGLSTDGMP